MLASIGRIVVGGLLAAGSLLFAAPANAATPTMTFTGSVNVLGVLTAVNLSPTAVSVPADGSVRFANSSGVPLTVTIGGQSVTIPDGRSRSATFTGASTERAVSASATAFDLPVVGSITSTTGTVTVGAAAPPQPSQDPQPGPSAGPPGDSSQGAPAPPALRAPPAASQPTAPRAPRSTTPRRTASEEPVVGIDPSEQRQDGADERPAPLDGALAGEQAAVSDTTVTTVGDGRGLGLLILVATVLLGGVGTAAIRSVISVRGARVAR
jgi:hypothetical protein